MCDLFSVSVDTLVLEFSDVRPFVVVFGVFFYRIPVRTDEFATFSPFVYSGAKSGIF